MDGNSRVAAEAAGGQTIRIDGVAGPAGTMRADVTLRQQQFRSDGRASRQAAPPLSMRLDRRQRGGKWQTTFTLLATDATRVQTRAGLVPLENPFVAARVEIDEDSGDTKIVDRHGRMQGLPGRDDTRRFGLSDADRRTAFDTRLFAEVMKTIPSAPPGSFGVAGLLADRRHRPLRRRDLERQFGEVAGRVRGLDRFVSTHGSEIREVLVAPTLDLPVELNVMTMGVLVQHTDLSYTPHAAGDLRHRLRTERALGPSAGGDRLVTEVALSNVALATGGVQ